MDLSTFGKFVVSFEHHIILQFISGSKTINSDNIKW